MIKNFKIFLIIRFDFLKRNSYQIKIRSLTDICKFRPNVSLAIKKKNYIKNASST